MKGYVYNSENNQVIAEIEGETEEQIVTYAEDTYGLADEIALTFSPAFGFTSGLVMTSESQIVKL